MTKIPNFKIISKDKLFYDKWRYCISFNLVEATVLKNLDHNFIDLMIMRRKEWAMAQINFKKTNGFSNILSRRDRVITDEQVANLHNLADQLINSSNEFKLVTSFNRAWIYSNELELIEELYHTNYITNAYCSEAVLSRPKDTIKLKTVNHTHRSYFKPLKLTASEKQNLLNFLENQTDYIRKSPAITEWINTPFNRLQEYFFIDHNGESWLVMLALIRPGLIRKTLEIIPS
jgi:hypothetical protein